MGEGFPSILPANAPQAGDTFARDFVVERLLGVGGMGFVFSALQMSAQRRVAIKMLLPDVARSEAVVSRFAREGRTARRIESPHCARVYDVGTTADGTPFLVMEYLEGTDLKELVEKRGRIAPTQAVDWVLEACEGIADAHEAKTVHRDLKPANLFLARVDGVEMIKVLDFGISKSLSAENSALHMTKTSEMLGSPYYMSPEQLKSSRDVDARSDIWALGVIVYELLSGRVPFDAPSLAELTVLILATEAPRLGVTEGVPAGLSEVVATCLRADPARRFGGVGELAEALAPYGSARARASAERIIQKYGREPVTFRSPMGSSPTLGQTQPIRQQSEPSFPPLAAAGVVAEQMPSPQLASTTAGVAQSIAPAPWQKSAWVMIAVLSLLFAGGVLLVAVGLQRRSARLAAQHPPASSFVATAPPPSAPSSEVVQAAPEGAPASAASARPMAPAGSSTAAVTTTTTGPGPRPAGAAPATARPQPKRPSPGTGMFGSEH